MIDYAAILTANQRVLFMKVGIIGAMEQEVTLLRDQIENRQTIQRAGCEIYTGQIGSVDVALLKSGIGKVSAAMGTTLLLEHCSPDLVINTGSAGGPPAACAWAISWCRKKCATTTPTSPPSATSRARWPAARRRSSPTTR